MKGKKIFEIEKEILNLKKREIKEEDRKNQNGEKWVWESGILRPKLFQKIRLG